MSGFQKYLNLATKSLVLNFPISIQVDSYKVDGCGDVEDEEGDWLANNYSSTTYTNISREELDSIYDGLNPHGHYRIIQL